MTWEPTPNLSEDLIRDFEEAFWKACKAGDAAFLSEAMQYGGATVANLVNAEGRAPLHFAAALNNGTLCQQLLDAGAPPKENPPPLPHKLHGARESCLRSPRCDGGTCRQACIRWPTACRTCVAGCTPSHACRGAWH